jgi:hypothetical protein
VERGGYTGFEVEIIPDVNLTTSNVLSTTNLYNIRISPARNAMRWFKSVSPTWSKEYASINKKLIFTSGEANYLAEIAKTAADTCYIEGTDGIAENQNINKPEFSDTDNAIPIWEPEEITLEYPLSWQDFINIKQNPKGLIKVVADETYYGWILDVDYAPNEGMAKWKLLRAYDAENRI